MRNTLRSDIGEKNEAANDAGSSCVTIFACGDAKKTVRKIVGSENFEIRTLFVRTLHHPCFHEEKTGITRNSDVIT